MGRRVTGVRGTVKVGGAALTQDGDPNGEAALTQDGDPNRDGALTQDGGPNGDATLTHDGDPNGDCSLAGACAHIEVCLRLLELRGELVCPSPTPAPAARPSARCMAPPALLAAGGALAGAGEIMGEGLGSRTEGGSVGRFAPLGSG